MTQWQLHQQIQQQIQQQTQQQMKAAIGGKGGKATKVAGGRKCKGGGGGNAQGK